MILIFKLFGIVSLFYLSAPQEIKKNFVGKVVFFFFIWEKKINKIITFQNKIINNYIYIQKLIVENYILTWNVTLKTIIK